jgi:ligand-binding sensor domain-containing protein/serine phosphatase RsbU (regulator of sigma subunit)
MSFRPFSYLIFLFFLLSCRQKQSASLQLPENNPLIIQTNGSPVSPDSIKKPEIKPARQPVPFQVTEKNSSINSINTRPAGIPEKVIPEAPYIARPGTAIFKSPVIVKARAVSRPCIQPQPVPAQRPRFKDDATCNIQYLDVDQGLTSSYVYKICEDKFGNIWFSTNSCLVKYDGKSFCFYTEKQGFVNSTVKAIMEDHAGNLWLGTNKGIYKYDGKSFTHYSGNEGKGYNMIRGIVEDKNNDLWFATVAGISRFDGTSFIYYGEEQGLVEDVVNCLFLDSRGIIWCGTAGGISSFDGTCFKSFTEKEGFVHNLVNCITEDKQGNIWFGTEKGACEYNGTVFKNYTAKEGLINNTIRSILADKNGDIWFTAYHGGMSKYDGKSFSYFTEKEGLSLNTIWTLKEDRSGNIWIGTDGGGLCKYSSRSFNHFTEKQGLNNIVINISEDKTGNLWFGTYGSGLCKYDKNSFVYYTDKQEYLSTIWCGLKDKKGNMWFGGGGNGLIKFDGKTFSRYSVKEGLSSNGVTCLMEDNRGDLWIGTNDGLNKFDGESFTHYTTAQGLTSNDIKSVAQDSKGNYWIATVAGLNKLTDNSVIHFTEKDGLSSNNIRSMLKAGNDDIWIGTIEKGLNIYDGKKLTIYTTKEGLSDNTIRSIVEDKPENLPKEMNGFWLSTDNGIDHILIGNKHFSDTDTIQKEVQIVVYSRGDGLKAVDFCSNSAFQDSKSRIWWGSVKGLTMLDAHHVKTKNEIPHVNMESIMLEHQFVDFRSLEDSIKNGKNVLLGEKNDVNLAKIKFGNVPAFYNYPLELELPYDINNITFNFSAIDWNSPHRLKFQFMLEGADKEWNPATSENKAVYTSLSDGSYTLKVKAKGASEIWSEPLEYKFIIHPPWWKSIWAYLFYACLFMTASFLLVKWRTSALRARQKELEQTVSERTADVVLEKNKVEEKNEIIEKKQKEILDSINYARRIQYSLLANDQVLSENLPEHFILFKPKDIVSGDFYWATKKNERFYLAVCDSTGHGVPGAFMSLLNISFLNEAVNEKNISEPHKVLNHVREQLIQNMDGGQDGMDAILVCFERNRISYSAAHNKPVLIRKGKVIELQTDKMPVGKGEKMESFSGFELNAEKGDMLYMFTDGYADQFGGEKGKKFKYKQLHETLISISEEPMNVQKERLQKTFESWKGTLEQIDDVCILGVRF